MKIPLNLKHRLVLGFILGVAFLAPAYPQDLDRETANLAARISNVLVSKGKNKIAVIDFVDLQGRPTELGRFIAEQLSVELVNVSGVSVMDRANLRSILAEHKLSEEGLVNPQTAKQLGQFAGVDAILTGSITSLDNSVSLTVKAISTDTAEIAAAGRITFVKTREVQQLLIRGVAGNESANQPGPSSSDGRIIAERDLGDLRVALTGFQRVKLKDSWGNPIDGFRCDFSFTNRNLNESAVLAINGINTEGRVQSGLEARSQLTDTLGNIWIPYEMMGLAVARVGGNNVSTSSIAEAIAYGKWTDRWIGFNPGRIWYGDLTVIPPGESIQASISYGPGSRDQSAGNVDRVQFSCEIVGGLATKLPNMVRVNAPTIRLYTLLWENIGFGNSGR
jgi:TolB-like protein